ncbi:MAG: ATP-binding cassette domain-containing protein [Treponema sp.]|nr:ATP-binding cassette domain-containing protein [Candidatus Treponema equifaecale]
MKEIINELNIQNGEFLLICGKSGSGKTTLLKALQNFYKEQNICAGYVMQNFDAQIVTDKVWHELSFALENQGMEQAVMRRRVAEAASYFGISEWMERETALLSGGQKQLLNLASTMAMTPKVLLLDEPTSQLDPIAAQNFLATVKKINRELGLTVIITEHRLEELFSEAERVLVLDEMKIKALGTPEEVAEKISGTEFEVFLPVCRRISGELTVAQARKQIRNWSNSQPINKIEKSRNDTMKSFKDSEKILELKNISFQYKKNESEILSELNLTLHKGEIFAILGANGSGKSTLLKILKGILKPASGKIKCFQPAHGSLQILMLPQNVRNCFTKKTVAEELGENIQTSIIDFQLSTHPYDLSGGEQQKLGLEKILAQNPDIILLDEPTKGLDNAFKKEFSAILKNLASKGISIVLVSHDIEFCAQTADKVSMMFEGQLTGTGTPKEFFSGNNFYTTSVNRITRGIVDGLVTEADFSNFLDANK